MPKFARTGRTAREPPGGSGGESRARRLRSGKEIRRRLPRSEQARWRPPRDRPDIVDLLRTADHGRRPELLPIRYARMASSPLGFLRGAAAVMASDLAGTARTGLTVQMAGDAHVSNFGLFATPERDLVFDVNDFDETLAGPWEWDLKRLATSLLLVGRLNRFGPGAGRRAVAAATLAYRTAMQGFARARYLDTWYDHLDLAEARRAVERSGWHLLTQEAERARERTGFHAFPSLATARSGRVRIRDEPPLLVHYRDRGEAAAVRAIFDRYPPTLPPERRRLLDRYRLVDVAQKVVGIGSVGTRCAVGLFLGDPDLLDPLFLQAKQAGPSVYEAYLGPSPFLNHAERVVVGQRLVQEASDVLLGWSSSEGLDFYVRQLRDMKFVSDIVGLGPRALRGLGALCGAALARAHARTGDPARIAGYVGRSDAFDRAVLRFGEEYARQTERDHAEFRAAVKGGRLPVAESPPTA
jgi:uncharacterized protein (DUF2252 family)